ncbi:MAG: AAA family ATPase, partial [Sulfurovum sp.]
MTKLPIGISDFKSLIEEDDYYYINKTNLIKEIIDDSAKVILLPRPRRFGKTLNLSMLRYFFDIKEDNRHLFENLSISKNDRIMLECNKYPIIYITFKDVKENNFDDSFRRIKRLVSNEFNRYSSVINNLDLTPIEKRRVDKILNEEADIVDIGDSFKLLSKLLTLAYKQKCIILIDEYDTPIQTGFIK